MTLPIILASSSPRRKSLLKQANIKYRQISSFADEKLLPSERPGSYAVRMAKKKALNASKRTKGIIIGADTVVVMKNEILGKPHSKSDAFRMLKLLNGKKHSVITGIAVLNTEKDKLISRCVRTSVLMDSMSRKDILSYIDSGEPFDKAGGYAIQGKGAVFIKRIEGCYFNVVGLPLNELIKMLREVGIINLPS